MYGYVYITTNNVNGKIYIGQKKGPYKKEYLGSGKMIGKAVKKHGSENFENHIIEWCESKEKLNEREIYWISKYNSFSNTGIGYNLARGGNQVNPLHAYTEEQLKEYGEKISKSNTGKKRSEEFCKRNSKIHKGKKLSEETKMKLSEVKKGKPVKDRKYVIKCQCCGEEFIAGNWNSKWCEPCRENGGKISGLRYMLTKQTEFQNRLGYDFSKMSIVEKSEYIKEMSLWVQNEVNEMIHELPYAKHWSKKYDSWDDNKIKEQIQLTKEELVDSMLFMLNIFACLEMTEDDIIDEYNKKNKINIERQNTGY